MKYFPNIHWSANLFLLKAVLHIPAGLLLLRRPVGLLLFLRLHLHRPVGLLLLRHRPVGLLLLRHRPVGLLLLHPCPLRWCKLFDFVFLVLLR